MLLIATILLLMQAPPSDELVSTRPPAIAETAVAAPPAAPSDCTRTELPFECAIRLQREGKAPPPPARKPLIGTAQSSGCGPGHANGDCTLDRPTLRSRDDPFAFWSRGSEEAGFPRTANCHLGESPDACQRRRANEAAIARAEAVRAEADAPPGPTPPKRSRCRRVETGEPGSASYSVSVTCGDDDSAVDLLNRTMEEQRRRVEGQP